MRRAKSLCARIGYSRLMIASLGSFGPEGGMRAVAYHEAGHAIVSAWVGLDPGRVVLNGPGDMTKGWARGQHLSDDDPRESREPARVRLHVLALLAGQMAELKWIEHEVSEENREILQQQAGQGATKDRQEALDLLAWVGISSEYEELAAAAQSCVDEKWSAIQGLAHALFSGGASSLGNVVEVADYL